jgi:twitching motility protein PilT
VSQIYSMLQAGGGLGMHTLDQDLRRLVEDGSIAMSVAKAYATDPSSLDDARVRPRELDAEAWSIHSSDRQTAGWGH